MTAWTWALPDRSEYCPSQIWMMRVGMEKGINTESGKEQVRIIISMHLFIFIFKKLNLVTSSFSWTKKPNPPGKDHLARLGRRLCKKL